MEAARADDTLERVRGVIARVYGCPLAALSAASRSEDVDGWDSVSFPGLLIELEEAFDVRIPAEAAYELDDVGALAALIGALRAKE